MDILSFQGGIEQKNISNLEVDAIRTKEKREDKWRKFVDDATVHI
jgi:hypothetical protein